MDSTTTQQPLEIRRVPLDSLHLDPANARHHPDENLDAITGSLRRFGQAEPLVVQKSSGRVVGGNGRLVAMKKLGWTECDIVELDIDDLTATGLGISLNRTSELASWSPEVLAKLLDQLRTEDALDGVGFDAADIDALLDDLQLEAELGDGTDETPAPAPPDDPVTRAGDIWVLGDHRLMCGDSASPEDLDRLLDGNRIQLVNTDPPYNVKVEPRSNNAIAAGNSSFRGNARQGSGAKMRAKDRPLANDFVTDEEFEALLGRWFGNIARVLEPGRAFYVWGGYSNLANYPRPLAENDLYFSQAIVWVKEHPVITRKDFMGNFEVSFYGWRSGSAHQYYGPKNATDVWSVKKVNPASMVHLTEKPVELASRAMLYSSKRGENVLDLFGGSGSTLMGAQETGRRAFLMEIDPPYCDVIINRWQKATGKTATLDGDGRTFDEITAERIPEGADDGATGDE